MQIHVCVKFYVIKIPKKYIQFLKKFSWCSHFGNLCKNFVKAFFWKSDRDKYFSCVSILVNIQNARKAIFYFSKHKTSRENKLLQSWPYIFSIYNEQSVFIAIIKHLREPLGERAFSRIPNGQIKWSCMIVAQNNV